MVIRFECNHCNKKLGIADTEAGKWIKCPGCGGKVRIPLSAGGGAAVTKKPAPAAKPPPKPPPPAKRRPAKGDPVEVDPIDEEPPRRAAKARRPARRYEDEDEDEDEDEEPRRRSRRARARRDEDEDEDEEDWDEDEDEKEKGVFSPNRIRGIVSIVVGGVVLAFGLLYGRLQEPDVDILKWAVVGLALLMFPVGMFYLVKG